MKKEDLKPGLRVSVRGVVICETGNIESCFAVSDDRPEYAWRGTVDYVDDGYFNTKYICVSEDFLGSMVKIKLDKPEKMQIIFKAGLQQFKDEYLFTHITCHPVQLIPLVEVEEQL